MSPSATETDLTVVKAKKTRRGEVKKVDVKKKVNSPKTKDQMSSAGLKCDICGKGFSKKSLDLHKRIIHKVTASGHPISKTKKRIFICEICNKDFCKKSGLVRHLQIIHPDVIEGDSFEIRVFKCEVEGCTFQTKHPDNLKRHKIQMHDTSKGNTIKTFHHCSLCTKKFSVLRNLRFHERKTHDVGDRVLNIRRQCPICTFVSTVNDKNEMYSHFETDHEITIVWENIKFDSMEEFLEWKKETERLTVTSYVRVFTSTGGLYFQCHRSGNYKKKGHDKRVLKLKGSCKINGYCPASMNVKEIENSQVEVRFLPTHVGHENEPEHIRQPAEQRATFKTTKQKVRQNKKRSSQTPRVKLKPPVATVKKRGSTTQRRNPLRPSKKRKLK